MRLLVTGAAGFIGSNFVRYWLERHPDDHVVAYDLLTYAGEPREPRGTEDRPVRARRHRRPRARRADPREHDIDVVVNFAAESHNSLAVRRSRRSSPGPTSSARNCCSRPRGAHGVQRFHHVSTCEVYGDLALDSDEAFTEESPYRPRTPYNASKARPTIRPGVPRDLRAADHDHELLEQLRAVPVPGEGDPALRHERAGRPAAAALRVHAEPARVAARARPLPRDRARPRAGPRSARRTTSAPASSSRSRRSPMPCSSSRARTRR